MKKIILVYIAVLMSISLFAQTTGERKKIKDTYDLIKLEKLKKELQKQELQKQENLDNYFESKRLSVFREFEENGGRYVIEAVRKDGSFVYKGTFNEGAAQTIKSRSLNIDLGLNGEGMYAGVWDEAIARPTHNEFQKEGGGSKIESYDRVTAIYNHSTHVAGTIANKGVSPEGMIVSGTGPFPAGYSKGIAPAASIKAADFINDLSEIADFAKEGYLVSNHSYGLTLYKDGKPTVPTNWWGLGAYDYTSYKLDEIARMSENYQMVVAAGNDRRQYNLINPEKQGYELLTCYAVAKNVLTVAAVEELLDYSNPASVKMSVFSNFGPTDDGRIKPNISAKGVNVVSTNSINDSSYYISSGTSMATPAITGAILLLQQHYKNLNTDYMKSATVRGLLQHTAKEAGISDGPDYSFGWGLADIESAAIIISDNNNGSLIQENKLENQALYTKKIKVSGSKPLQVSISWTDPESKDYNGDILGNSGIVSDGDKDPVGAKYLVNDLDVKVVKKDVKDQIIETYYPWKLNVAEPSAAATNNTTNDVDNFERIDIPNPSGEYTIIVSHKGNLSSGQAYSLMVTGSDLEVLGVEDLETPTFNTKVYPIPAHNTVFVSVNEKVKYTILEMTGKTLLSGDLSEGNNAVNISALSSGMYLIKLDNGTRIETKKILIK